MSTLKADTIQSTGGGAATLTKQSAAKAFCYNNKKSTTARGLVTDGISSQSLNISSNSDVSTGRTDFTLTNAMSAEDYAPVGMTNTANKNLAINNATCTSSVLSLFAYDADTGSSEDQTINFALFGDLA